MLNPLQHAVLGLGLKFIPNRSASINKIRDSLTSSLNNFQRHLLIKTYFYDKPSCQSAIPRIIDNSWIPNLTELAINNPPMHELHTNINNFINASIIKVQSLTIHSHLSTIESLINSTLFDLRKNQSITIQAADKNLGTCIMYTSTYLKYCQDILDSATTYCKVDIPPHFNEVSTFKLPFITQGYARLKLLMIQHKLYYADQRGTRKRKFWQHLTVQPITTTTFTNTVNIQQEQRNDDPLPCPNDNIPRPLTKLAKSLLQLAHDSCNLRPAASFYVLLKMHKPTISARPIANSINTMTYHASIYLDKIFRPIIKTLETVTSSSTNALLALEALPPILSPLARIYCADVKNLYPSIPIDYGITAVRKVLTSRSTLLMDIDFHVSLLHWVLTNSYITHLETTYKQISGTAMGTPVAPAFADMVLYNMEQQTFSQLHGQGSAQPIIYFRYLDDLLAIFPDATTAQEFTNSFNQLCNDIQLDAVTIDTSGIFMDMKVSLKEDGKCEFQLYQKAMNKYLYLPPQSSHRKHIFHNFILNEIKRYRLLNSKTEDFSRCKEAFFHRLTLRGHTTQSLRDIFNESLPSRKLLLQDIISKRNLKEQRKISSFTLKTPPIAVVNLPKISLATPTNSLHEFSTDPTRIFSLPVSIINSDIFKKTFNCSRGQKPIIARKLNKNIHRIIFSNSSSMRPHSVTPTPHGTFHRGEP